MSQVPDHRLLIAPRGEGRVPHHRLLIAQCGEGKLTTPARGVDLYTGPLWQSIRTHWHTPDGRERCRIAVLSAEYGLYPGKHIREPYDRKMTAERAAEIGRWTMPHFNLFEGIQEVCIVGGNVYAGLGGQIVGSASKAGHLPRGYHLTVIVDEIGLMRQRMNAWLKAEG